MAGAKHKNSPGSHGDPAPSAGDHDQNYPSPSNPLGVKGGGEGAIIPVGGLMANAVANALASFGAMPNELPLSPPRVWRLANPS
jgi:CO/xanthine dehydrogenase Mo-binding subunit